MTNGKWAFNDFCLNISEAKSTTISIQQSTFDTTYADCSNSTIGDDSTFIIHENANGEFVSEKHDQTTHEYKSYIKLQLKIRQNLAENETNLAVLFGDDTSFTGLHFEIDEVEFASKCD